MTDPIKLVRIQLAESEGDIRRCFPVMKQLRVDLDVERFVAQVGCQQQSGYRLAFAEQEGAIAAVAGYRITESLSWGKFLYVDDLVTDSTARSQGIGGRLLDWLMESARSAGCGQLHLDSGLARTEAHRFYLEKGMQITSHHFAIKL